MNLYMIAQKKRLPIKHLREKENGNDYGRPLSARFDMFSDY